MKPACPTLKDGTLGNYQWNQRKEPSRQAESSESENQTSNNQPENQAAQALYPVATE